MKNPFKHSDKDFAQDFIQQRLNEEVFRNEQLRFSILTAFFAMVTLLFLVLPWFSLDDFQFVTRGKVPIYAPPLFFAAVCIYLITARRLLGLMWKKHNRIPLGAQIGNAFFETSIPTLAIFFVSQMREPMVLSLHTPPAYVYFLFIILSSLRLNKWLCIWTGGIAAVEYLLLYLWISSQTTMHVDYVLESPLVHVVRASFYLIGGIATGLATAHIKTKLIDGFNSLEERNRITSIFGQHVSPSVVEKLLKKETFENEIREVCVLFFDIRNFTTYSEKRNPDEVVDFLNNIFSICIEIVNNNGGIINKFLGDGFMAVFGAPLSSGEDAKNSVNAAIQIVNELNRQIPTVNVGMGIHAGFALTGNVGSEARKEYTVIGDVVNVASRIEQLNKQYETRILISDDVMERYRVVESQELGFVNVKGRAADLKIYKVI